MKQPIEYRCPKCDEGPGNPCRDMRHDKKRDTTSLSSPVGWQGLDYVSLVKPHRERVSKAKGEWSDPSMIQDAITNARRSPMWWR